MKNLLIVLMLFMANVAFASGSITVTIIPPTNDGGHNLSNYRVEYRLANSSDDWQVYLKTVEKVGVGVTTIYLRVTVTISNLTNAATYEFRVCATTTNNGQEVFGNYGTVSVARIPDDGGIVAIDVPCGNVPRVLNSISQGMESYILNALSERVLFKEE